MSADELSEASRLIDLFEADGPESPQVGEQMVAQIFRACGYGVTESGFIGTGPDGGRRQIDCFFRTTIEDAPQLIGVEIKSMSKPVDAGVVDQAVSLRHSGPFDRIMIISRVGFTNEAIDRADAIGLGELDLFDPGSLRNWINKQLQISQEIPSVGKALIRAAMKEFALAIATNPAELWQAQWFDLERILRETFEGIGFDTRITRPAKDGGFDLELTRKIDGQQKVYLIEVKHWTDQKPGASHLKKLIRVTASRKATGGFLLSSSGFTKTIYSGIAEYSAPVRLGDGNKIVSICKTYQRINSGFWLPGDDPHTVLFSDTRALGEAT